MEKWEKKMEARMETRYGNTWPVGVLFICISLDLMRRELRQSPLPLVKLTVTKIALPRSTRSLMRLLFSTPLFIAE